MQSANKFRKSIPPGALNHGMFPANAQSELPSLFAVGILLRLVARSSRASHKEGFTKQILN
jgi:hypothetical protein